jgi:hypothetical protein
MSRQRAGVLGRGLYGTAVTLTGSDPDALLETLKHASATEPITLFYCNDPASASPKIWSVPATPQLAAKLAAAIKSNGNHMIAKRFESYDAFHAEIFMNIRVASAYGKHRAAMTTIAMLPVDSYQVCGITVPMSEGAAATVYHVSFSQSCSRTGEHVEFKHPANLDHFIKDMLQSFAVLHRGKLLHADVKLDNLMLCQLHQHRRFKLIDWGATISFDEARTVIDRMYRPKNLASPAFWVAWGLDDVGGTIARVVHIAMHAKLGSKVPYTVDYARFCLGAYDSFLRFVDSLNLPQEGLRDLLKSDAFLMSYDLYNLGIMLLLLLQYSKAVKTAPVLHAAIMELVKRLMYYDHPQFLGTKGAEAALAWWNANAPPSTTAHRARESPRR